MHIYACACMLDAFYEKNEHILVIYCPFIWNLSVNIPNVLTIIVTKLYFHTVLFHLLLIFRFCLLPCNRQNWPNLLLMLRLWPLMAQLLGNGYHCVPSEQSLPRYFPCCLLSWTYVLLQLIFGSECTLSKTERWTGFVLSLRVQLTQNMWKISYMEKSFLTQNK